MTDRATIKKEFISTIAATLCDFNMLEQNTSVLVAVSGGPDSVALVLSLMAIREKQAITMGIAHLNHMLRGEDSLKDEAFVKELASKLDLVFHTEQKDVTAYAKTHGLSIEEAGREVRYDFFNRLSELHGYKKIATGHTKDDNAELVLMNLLRGSGPKGLSGIPPVRDCLYIRPLIRVSKSQILDFLKAENQPYRIDASNTDPLYLRNKIRCELIPHLKEAYNPEIMDALDRLSHILKQENDYLDIETKKQFNHCLINMDDGCVELSKTLLSGLHPAILNRVFRKAILTIKKDLKRISLVHLKDITAFCFDAASGVSLDLPDRIRIYKKDGIIMLKKEDAPLREIGKKEKQARQQTAQKNQKKKS